MAYQFVDAVRLDADLTAVADAIRSKGGTAEQLSFPSGMTAAISAISTGVELTFDVVGGTTTPTNPQENTIWVNTNVAITAYSFKATPPGVAEGRVWIQTGNSSNVMFDALKTNWLFVYPISAKQYVGGAWVFKPAKIYQSGSWHDLGTYIVQNGVAKVDFSGNLRNRSDVMTVTSKTGYLDVVVQNSFNMGPATNQKMDVTNFSLLTLECDVVAIPNHIAVVLASALNASTSDALMKNIVASKATTQTGRQIIECNIEGYSGEYYVAVHFYDTATQAYTRQVKIYNLFLS